MATATRRDGPGRPKEYTHALVAQFSTKTDRVTARDTLRQIAEKHPTRERESNRRGMVFEVKGFSEGRRVREAAKSIPNVKVKVVPVGKLN